MSSVLRSVKKRKKGRTLGGVDVIDREEYAELEVDAKVELIRSLVPLGLMHIEELLDEEVTALAGERYARKDPSVGGRRHGSNPGTVGLAGQRVPIRVPRIRHVTESEIPRRSDEALHGDRAVNDLLLRRVLYGISCRNYEAAAEVIPGAIGLSGSTVSRAFIRGQRGQAPRAPRAGPVPGGRRRPGAGRQDLRRVHDGRGAGHHDDGGETLPGLCRDGHREREGVDTVPPVLGRTGPRRLPGTPADPGWWEGTSSGRAGKRSATAPWCNGVRGTSARTW